MPFLFSEDQALKDWLSGITVADDNDPERKVGVWFRYPDPEERQVSFPFLTIDLADITEETDREHRGYYQPDYVPEGYEEPEDGWGQKMELPIPVSIIYRITSYARSAYHDRQIQNRLMGWRLPLRFGGLHVEADDTVRRLDFLDWAPFDGFDANNKRVFRKVYTVAISSELLPEAMVEVQKVATVDLNLLYQLDQFEIAIDA